MDKKLKGRSLERESIPREGNLGERKTKEGRESSRNDTDGAVVRNPRVFLSLSSFLSFFFFKFYENLNFSQNEICPPNFSSNSYQIYHPCKTRRIFFSF